MKTNIEFEVKNGAFEPLKIRDQIVSKVFNHGIMSYDESATFEGKLYKYDLTSFYLPSGAKVTTQIKKDLVAVKGKEIVNPLFPKIAKDIANLYSPAFKVKAYFGDKNYIGTGKWGDGGSCFNDDGCNSSNRVFLEGLKRAKVLVLKMIDDTKLAARCLVYFPGGRKINLFNFYYSDGFNQNKLLFVEAIRRMLRSDKVTYTEHKPKLPIYLNKGAIEVHFGRTFDYPFPRKWPCPSCGNVVFEENMLTDINGSNYLIGCSDDCLGDTDRITCCNCGDRVSEDDTYSNEDDGPYCEECYDERYRFCDNCSRTVSIDDMYEGCCTNCGIVCNDCGESFPSGEIVYGPDSEDYCIKCYRNIFSNCQSCGEACAKEDLKEGPDDYSYCESCYGDEFKTCEECGNITKCNELENDLCADCVKEVAA